MVQVLSEESGSYETYADSRKEIVTFTFKTLIHIIYD